MTAYLISLALIGLVVIAVAESCHERRSHPVYSASWTRRRIFRRSLSDLLVQNSSAFYADVTSDQPAEPERGET